MLYSANGEYDKAAQLYVDGLKRNPDAEAYNNLGIIYGQLKRYDLARAAFEQAIKLNPNDQKARNNLNLLQKMIGQ